MKILVVNAGSSSIKFQLFQMPEANVLAKGRVERIGDKHSELFCFYNGQTYRIERKVANHKKVKLLLG